MAAQFCRDGAAIADIGTDHAYLPIYLVQTGRAVRAIASDIATGPLNSAKKNIDAAGLAGLIELRLGDGLTTIGAQDADDIFICGMGGLVMSEMIDSAAWLKHGDKRLILQPMTKAYELRKFLFSNGFDIIAEKAVRDARKIYTVMCAEYVGGVDYEDLLCYTGRLAPSTDLFARNYLIKVCLDLDNRINGAKATGDYAVVSYLSYIKAKIEEIADIK
ncbi:MAG TPA: class I SAM-dependent methyltransferase [Firmicutes bacterium]|nr:class I SAM-dependent methyltransferase [Bacillota bacterium]